MIQLENVTKVYRTGNIEVHALKGVSCTVQKGEMVSIMGASGSGKSTLMNMIGCLDVPTSGRYMLDGQDVSRMGDDSLAQVRNRKIGFVFQTHNLLPRLTGAANVELPLLYSSGRNARRAALEALGRVGLGRRAAHHPSELSGGEQQRVGIARALVKSPSLILADEPTGNLDLRASAEIMAIFQRLNREEGITIVIVTHEPDIAEHTSRTISMRDGEVISDHPVFKQRVAVGTWDVGVPMKSGPEAPGVAVKEARS